MIAQHFFGAIIRGIGLIRNGEASCNAILFRVHATTSFVIFRFMILVKATSRVALFTIVTLQAVLALLLTLRTMLGQALRVSHLELERISAVRLRARSVLIREVLSKITRAV